MTTKRTLELLDLTVHRKIVIDGTEIGSTLKWEPMTDLSAQVAPNTAVFPSSKRELDKVILRGQLAWSAQTIAADTVLAILHEAHWPRSPKIIDLRTSPNSNVATQIEIATNGEITNVSGLGNSTTAVLSFDGKFFDLE